MKTFDQFRNQLEEDTDWLFEMTGIAPKNSGLDYYIWISSKGNAKHSCRIKVSNVPGQFSANDNFSLRVHKGNNHDIVAGTSKLKPKDLRKIQSWISLNYDALIEIWNNQTLDSSDHFSMVRKI